MIIKDSLIAEGFENEAIRPKDEIDDGKRRRTRALSPLVSRRLDDNDTEAASSKKSRTSLRGIKYCTDIKALPHEYHCDG